jgi:hypothetical protein
MTLVVPLLQASVVAIVFDLGRSFHWALVRKIQRIPFNTVRGSRQGRPRPSARRGGTGIIGAQFVAMLALRLHMGGRFIRTYLPTPQFRRFPWLQALKRFS